MFAAVHLDPLPLEQEAFIILVDSLPSSDPVSAASVAAEAPVQAAQAPGPVREPEPRISLHLIKSSLYYFIGGVLVRAGSIVLLPIFTRALSPAEYGMLELLYRATDVMLLFLFLNGTCLAAISLYNQAKSDERKRHVASSSLVFGFACVGSIGLVATLFAEPIGRLIGVPRPGLVRLAFASALVDALVTVCLSLAQARIQARFYVAASLTQLSFRVVLIALFVLVFGWGIRGILLATLITSGILCSGLVVLEALRFGLEFEWEVMAEIARFSLPFLPAGVCGFLLGAGDQFFLVRYVSTAEVGLYALGYKLAAMTSTFARDPFIKVWGAQMHRTANNAGAPRQFGRLFSCFVGLNLFAGLGITLFCGDILAVLSDPRYSRATIFVPPVVLAYLFWGCGDFMDGPFYIRRRTNLKLMVTLLSTAVTVGLYILLIPLYHAWGAAMATLGGFAFRLALTFVVTRRFFSVEYEWGRVFALCAVTLACWLPSRFLAGQPSLPGVAAKLALWLSWPVLLWTSGVVTASEKRGLCTLVEQRWGVARLARFWRKPAACARDKL